jgi:CBS domain-containing protein
MLVADILRSKGNRVATIAGGATLEAAARRLSEEGIGALVVLDAAGGVAGVVSERDIVQGLARHGGAALAMDVSEFMRCDVPTCLPGDSVLKVMALMTDRRVRHLPVVADGELRGIISVGDAVKHRIDEIEAEAKALHEYIRG